MEKYNIIRNRGLRMTVKLLGAAFFILHASCFISCSDWDDHYDAAHSSGGSGTTLWQQIQAQSELSDFCKVLQQTKVFRMHKKTTVSYADLLDSGQLFTVVAPKNGTFNADSLLRLTETNQGDSVVEKNFVLNHLSRSTTSLTAEDQQMLMLNSKYVTLGGNTIQGINISQPNCHAKNGILHIADASLPYEYNLYEALCDMADMSAVGAILRLYEWDDFDAEASVSSGLVEGVPVYVDSVVYERNRMLDYIGLIHSEDSTYWVVAPTQAGWQKAWDETSKYFVYDESVKKGDSLQTFWTARALLSDAVFNMTDQKSVDDSLVSVPYINWRRSYVAGKPVYHVFNKPFATGGILAGARRVECSNGVLYKTDEWPFKPEETFFKEIWVEGENIQLITETDTYKKNGKDEPACYTNIRRQVADSISENSYLQIVPADNSKNWGLTFNVKNTLSGCYDICAIILPKSVYDPVNPDVKPCKFKADINYVDEKGKSQKFKCNAGKDIKSDPEKVDTIVLAEAFTFPTCNYDQNNTNVTVKLTCSISPLENTKYAREMYLDCIYLRPKMKNE